MSNWTTIATLVALGCVVTLYIGRRSLGKRSCYPLPPGPSGLPWVGNVIGLNPSAPWITYAEWARKYGDIVYARLLGKDVIVVNSEKIAKDLLEKRSRNYSDRPYLITAEMCGVDFHSIFLPYGNQWRMHRRFFHQTFRPDAVSRFLPLQHHKACHLLRRLFDGPEHLDDHVFEYTASVILNSTYDYDPTSREDELVEIIADALKVIVPAVRPEVAIVIDAIPLLLRLPSWFPGMSFRRQMATARAFSKQYLERPFQYSLQRMTRGTIAPSMVRDALANMEEKGMPHEESWMEELKKVFGSALMAASETSHSVLMTFFLLMVLNPAAQEKAQAQIDAMVGKGRLPTIDDRPLLPFVDAVFWEILRYSPILPLSFPHAAVADDVYNGFHIPKGAMVITNVWSIAHDETKYPNPDAFIPERFLNDDGSLKPNDVEHITFGFGRRMCVGRHFADTSVWGAIAKVLAVFKILKALDKNGVEIPVEPRFSTGMARHPLPFRYRIVPRFPGMDAEKLEQLISSSTS